VWIVAGCTSPPADGSSTTDTSAAPTTSSTTVPSSCEGVFFDDGELLSVDNGHGDARRISSLHSEQNSGCERFVVGFATETGAPATSIGSVQVEFLRDVGLVRISLPNLTETSITDGVFESPLVDRAYVVRSADGSLHVDAHLGAPALARAEVVQSPARVVVELKAGGSALPEPSYRSDIVVLLTPRVRKVSYPITVSGYARTFEGTVVIRLQKANEVVDEQVTTATDYLDAWGEFSTVIESGPLGNVTLTVGDDGEQDVTIDLVVN
jgi:hypothetical protein